MSINEMDSKVQELRELRRMKEELEAEITAAEDTIKSEMTARNVDTLTGTNDSRRNRRTHCCHKDSG